MQVMPINPETTPERFLLPDGEGGWTPFICRREPATSSAEPDGEVHIYARARGGFQRWTLSRRGIGLDFSADRETWTPLVEASWFKVQALLWDEWTDVAIDASSVDLQFSVDGNRLDATARFDYVPGGRGWLSFTLDGTKFPLRPKVAFGQPAAGSVSRRVYWDVALGAAAIGAIRTAAEDEGQSFAETARDVLGDNLLVNWRDFDGATRIEIDRPARSARVWFHEQGTTADIVIDPTMSAAADGAAFEVTGDNYEIQVDAGGVDEIYALKSVGAADIADTQSGINLCTLWGTVEARSYSLGPDGTVTLDEDTPTRVTIKCTGSMEPSGGGTQRGTGTFYVHCYPDRFVCTETFNMATNPTGGVWIGRAFLFQWLPANVWGFYQYATTATGAYSADTAPGASRAHRTSGTGPFSFIWGIGGNTDYSIGAAWQGTAGWGTVQVDDRLSADFLVIGEEASLSLATDYTSSLQVDFYDVTTAHTLPSDAHKARRIAYLDPDNLDGSGDDGDVLVGTLKTNHALDVDTDGFAEGLGAFAVTADAYQVKVKFARDPGVAGENDVFHPVIECHDVGGTLDYAKSSANGSDWDTLVSGTDFNVQTTGAVRAFQYLGDEDQPFYLDIVWETPGDADDLTHGHALDSPTISQRHVATPADLAHAHLLDYTGAYELVTGSPVDLLHGHSLEYAVAVSYPTGSPDDLLHGNTLDAVAGSQTYIGSPDDLLHGHALDATAGFEQVPLFLSGTSDGHHRISWAATGVVSVAVDGKYIAQTEDGFLDCSSTFPVRGVLVAYAGDMPAILATPLDMVRASVVSGDNVIHHVERQPDGGAWTRIATIGYAGATYDDGPLEDGLYHYRLVAEDDSGDTATSATHDATVSSFPEPPTGLTYSWNATTKTLTLSWTASTSADVATYRVREGNPLVELDAAADWDGAATTWNRVFTTETGVYSWLVRAVDADGNEEQNISELLVLAFQDAGGGVGTAPTALPAEPRIVGADAIAGGKITVNWLYDPRYEDPKFSNAGFEARIYWDNATGTVSFAAPVATVAMSAPDYATRFSWTSGVLVDASTYKFVVRIGTAAHPDGLETDNTGEYSATADSSVPSTPTLSVEVV